MKNSPRFSDLLDLFGFEFDGRLSVVGGDSLAGKHVPNFPPDAPALIVNPGRGVDLTLLLRAVYPAGHGMRALTAEGVLVELALADLGRWDDLAAIFVPPLGEFTSFESFHEVIAHLRAPEGCPWDREQTHQSLRKHLLEEVYETLDALDALDSGKMREEFGDLLLQIVLHAQIASETGSFDMAGVIRSINDKIIRRHPHVFGNTTVKNVDQVLANWEALKAEERKSDGVSEKGLLDGLPASLPSLSLAHEYQDRAARVGFDWPGIDGVLEKIWEEMNEVRAAENSDALESELGDLFFTLVNLARWKHVDAESALRGANMRFKRRFGFVEQQARARGQAFSQLSLDEMEALWQAAKRQGL